MGRLIQAYFNWSGGKDSTLALYKVLQDKQFDIRYLLTTLNEEADRISMHGVRSELLTAQAESLGIPAKKVHLPASSDMQAYESVMSTAIEELKSEGISDCIFGDIFLEDLRTYREGKLREVSISAHFPLWKRNTEELMREFIDLGFKTIVVCVDSSKLDESFAGRVIDHQFLSDLPDNVDPCGENGEFHTFVFDGPIFRHPISFQTGEKVLKTYTVKNQEEKSIEYGFWFQDLIPI
ncbi:diphthine--ammonia ligase [uncultured Fluviicola sp.]|uniref:Dph6-related ATP pyrophosphatase n=1 Tax=uncultured Fluviicola sp. TaxID=463303 RepID=UPI0025E84939|nr:diphthine--ammonia ligase [uncultured Fluviicola sp.]